MTVCFYVFTCFTQAGLKLEPSYFNLLIPNMQGFLASAITPNSLIPTCYPLHSMHKDQPIKKGFVLFSIVQEYNVFL